MQLRNLATSAISIFVLTILQTLQTIEGARGFGLKTPKFQYTGKVQPSLERPPTLLVPESIKRPDYAIDGIPKVLF